IGTYSHFASDTVFPKKTYKKIPCETVYIVFKKVLDNDSDFGVVPAENSIEGTVKGTLDYLVDFSLTVIGSFDFPIHHQLATLEKSLKDITYVVSHPQAFAQCERWIRKNLPQAKLIPSASTTASMDERKKGHAYICSELAASVYKMGIVAKNIEDNPRNSTRFYIISKKQMQVKGLSNQKTLIFLTIYNRVGILRDILNVFANNEINLTKLESRPSMEKIWDYHFFVEVEGNPENPSLKKALQELEVYCPIIRVLGQT
ncbi:MAG: prephenate dehydratase, partial [Candidatus Levybacteria bacterium]|nr:prephenate dehydratase [Candidatus Levybacteria bacterium]